MSEPEQRPASDLHDPGPRRVSRRLVRDLAIVFVILALGYGFGRPLAAGYYFGGCDNAEDVQQYMIHVFGIEMCRDVALTAKSESKAQREAEAASLTELFGEERASPAEGEGAGAPEEERSGAPPRSIAPPAASGGGSS